MLILANFSWAVFQLLQYIYYKCNFRWSWEKCKEKAKKITSKWGTQKTRQLDLVSSAQQLNYQAAASSDYDIECSLAPFTRIYTMQCVLIIIMFSAHEIVGESWFGSLSIRTKATRRSQSLFDLFTNINKQINTLYIFSSSTR